MKAKALLTIIVLCFAGASQVLAQNTPQKEQKALGQLRGVSNCDNPGHYFDGGNRPHSGLDQPIRPQTAPPPAPVMRASEFKPQVHLRPAAPPPSPVVTKNTPNKDKK